MRPDEPNTLMIAILMTGMLLALPIILLIKNPPNVLTSTIQSKAATGAVDHSIYPKLGFTGRLVTDPASEILDAAGAEDEQ